MNHHQPRRGTSHAKALHQEQGQEVNDLAPATQAAGGKDADALTLDAINKNRQAMPGAVFIPLTLLTANRFNPRKRVDAKAIGELADSIAKVGLLQPIVVRPRADAPAGEPQYEIVAGERRWRACQQIADALKTKRGPPPTIGAIVRELDDYQAMEIATVENLERVDLHPLEEAEGYDMLLHPPIQTRGAPAKPLTAKELATKLGKSPAYISQRLKLLSLVPAARDAFFNDKLQYSVAVQVARVPQEQQAKLLKEVLQGWGGAPMTHAQAFEHIHRTYMLELSRAPFKITDATLVPEAGSCRECPKRTGANPDLFNDVKNGDTCTDSACFNRKVDAEQQRKKLEAEASGKRVLDEVKPGEYMRLDQHDYNVSYDKTIGQLLGKGSKVETVLIKTEREGYVPAVKAADAKAELKAKGVIKPRAGAGNNHLREAQERSKTGTAWRRAVAIECLNNMVGQELDTAVQLGVMRLLAETAYFHIGSDSLRRMHDLHGSKSIEIYSAAGQKKLRAAIYGMPHAHLVRFTAALAIADDLALGTYAAENKAADSRLRELAGMLGVDVDAMRLEITAERKAKVKSKTPAKKAAKANPTRAST